MATTHTHKKARRQQTAHTHDHRLLLLLARDGERAEARDRIKRRQTRMHEHSKESLRRTKSSRPASATTFRMLRPFFCSLLIRACVLRIIFFSCFYSPFLILACACAWRARLTHDRNCCTRSWTASSFFAVRSFVSSSVRCDCVRACVSVRSAVDPSRYGCAFLFLSCVSHDDTEMFASGPIACYYRDV